MTAFFFTLLAGTLWLSLHAVAWGLRQRRFARMAIAAKSKLGWFSKPFKEAK